MDKTVIVVSAVVGTLGLLSAILGFAAERTKITISDVRVSGDECLYPQNPSLRLGLCAAVLLLMAQVTVSAIGGCCCCSKPHGIPSSETNRAVGIICAVVSWIAAVIAVVLFVEGAAWNANVARDTAPVCYFLKDGVFAAAAVLALAATVLGVASYVMLRRLLPDDDEAPAGAVASWRQPLLHAGIAMGHPQFPPHPQWHSQAAAGSGAGTSAGREEPVVVAIKMDKTTIIVSSVVGSLGVLSAILGFAAEAAKLTDCASSLGLAVAATIFLMMAQVTVAAVGGCCGCCKSRAVPSETKRIVGVVCASISWVAAVIAFALFVDGSIGAAVACVGLVGEFAGAGVLVLVATGLGITSFIMLRMNPQAGEAAAGVAPREYDEPTPIGTPIDIHGFRPPMPPNPQVTEPLPNYPPPPYSPAPAPAPAPAQGNDNQAPNQQFAPHPQGHAQIEVPAGREEPAAVLAIKMDKTTIIVSAVVGSLGLLSAILGFAAEGAKRTKATFSFKRDDYFLSDVEYRCELDLYDLSVSSNSTAVGLGVCGAIFLVITQVTVAAIGGCCGCCKSRAIPSETKRIVGVVCAVFSWITAVIAFVLFLDGAIVESNCILVRGGFFASAGVLTLITTGLGMTSYFMLRAQPQPNEPAAPADGDEPTPIVGVPTVPGFPPPVSPNPLLVPVAAQAPNPQFAHPATQPQQGGGTGGYGQAPPHSQFADAAVPAPAAAQGYGSQAPNQQRFPANPQGHSEGQP
uniref:Uncharacterized protein n=1 Tax=Oryza punctata TaxID=4537 RepID=A0A0E0L2Y3_ORYPU